MEYQEFKMMIKERLQKMIGGSVEVTIETYYKNNQTQIESLVFKEKAANIENSFERRMRKGNWWENGNECLNMQDINKPPQYYTGTDKEWIEEITTYIYLYPVAWQAIYEQYKSSSKKRLALQFYRNEEGYLRRVGIDEVYLKIKKGKAGTGRFLRTENLGLF